MIQYIFNVTPEKAGFQWEWANAVFGLLGIALGFLLTWARDKWTAMQSEKKEKEEFLEIKGLMPEIINLIKKGLDKNPLGNLLSVQTKTNANTEGHIKAHENRILYFGEDSIDFSSDTWRKHYDRIDYLSYRKLGVKTTQMGYDIRLTPEFLSQIKKWGHLK